MSQYKIKKVLTSGWVNFFAGLTLGGFGIAFLINQNIFTRPLTILFAIITIYHFISIFLRVNLTHRSQHITQFVIFLGLTLIFNFHDNFVFSTLGLFLVLWSLINTMIRFMNIYFYRAINQKFRISDILLFVFNLGLSIGLLIFNQFWSHFFVISFSVYLIYYGIELILLVFRDKLIKLPTFISFLLPAGLLKRLEAGQIETVDRTLKDDESSFVNIYVYMGKKLQDKVGHVDIGFENIIYSYGAHDPAVRNKFFLWGNGVLVKADEKRFIDVSLSRDEKTIIKFVYHLNEHEKQALKQQIQNLMQQTIDFPWAKEDRDDDHYVTLMSQGVGKDYIDFYLFKEGSIFKTYNLLKVNCVLVAYYLLNSSQVSLFDISGIITPGAYYETLFQLYNSENSPISEMSVLKGTPLQLK